jgi:Sulfotransferase family
MNANGIPPLFMFGFDRSGTTLLSMMVGSHPLLAVPFSTTGLWFRYEAMLPDYNHLESAADVERLVDDLLREERIRLWDAELSREALLESLPAGSYGAVVRRFHSVYASSKGKRYWANIDIATIDHMDLVNQWFPDSRFIHLVRDGRDVALSHETYPYGASNTLECALEWRRRVETNIKMGAILGPSRYRVFRYEDLVLDTEATLEALCRFIGLPFSPEMLDYERGVKEKVPDEKRWLWPALDQKPVKTNAYRWKSKMSRAKRIVFEANAGATLNRLGYETFERIPKRASAYLLEIWQFLGRGGRFKRLASRVGASSRQKSPASE